MSNYVKAVDFESKDSLTTGNPLKIIKGVELNDEFNAIQTAIATKADITSPAFLGNPTATTQSSSDSSTRLATTAFVAASVQNAYPIGSIYINASVATNPGTLFGFGTWVAFGVGRMLVGFDAGDTLFDTAEETGGSKDAVVASHTHTASQASHTHTTPLPTGWSSGGSGGVNFHSGSVSGSSGYTGVSNAAQPAITVDTAGVSATNANLPPYITVYMWKRTA